MHETNISNYIVRSHETGWQSLIENEVYYKGIAVKSLHYDEAKQRSTTILLKFDAGASYPYHNHLAGEEIFVLHGEAMLESTILKEGDYLYTPPGYKHSVSTQTGCTLLLVIPEEVEILN